MLPHTFEELYTTRDHLSPKMYPLELPSFQSPFTHEADKLLSQFEWHKNKIVIILSKHKI